MNKSLYINAALCKNTQRPPVWMMRQAGRYMDIYQDIRKHHSFLDMVYNPELACAITLQPIDAFGMDAAILFSDILVTAQALGADLDFVESVGPVIENPIRSIKGVEGLYDKSEILSPIYDAIKLLKKELTTRNTPLIGFAGAPFTVAAYMVEGQSSSTLIQLKTMMGTQPECLHQLLQKLTEVTKHYLSEQIKAGVDSVQLFDTWAGLLSWDDFHAFSLPYMKDIVDHLKDTGIPITLFTKNSGIFFQSLKRLNPNVIALDWQSNLADFTQNHSLAIQGNLDPYLLFYDEAHLKQRVIAMLETMKEHPGYIFNLGHGIHKTTDPNKVKFVVDLVQSYDYKKTLTNA